MFPYILTFLLSLLFMCLVNKGKRLSSGKKIIGGIFVILPLALLGAFRDKDVGTDLMYYAIPIWNDAVSSVNRGSELTWYGVEKSYLLLNYACALVSSKLQFFLFVLQALTLLPIFLAAVKVRRYASPVLIMFLYLFVMYNATFNLMRQSMALSVSLLAFVYLFLERKKSAYVLYVLALLLHVSAIISLLVLGVYYVMTNFHLTRKKISAIAFVVVACFAIGVVFSQQLIMFAIGSGLIDVKYAAYTSASGDGLFGARLNKSCVAYDAVVLMVLYAAYRKNKQDRKLYALVIIGLMSLLFEFTGLVSYFLPRIALYPRMISMFSLPYVFLHMKRSNFKRRLLYQIPFEAFVVFYWIFTFVISNSGETYPYTF